MGTWTIRKDNRPVYHAAPSELRVYSPGECIVFYRIREAHGCLSNMAPMKVQLGGMRFRTAEHAYQAQRLCEQPELLEEAMAIPGPVDMKRFVYSHRGAWHPDWESDYGQEAVRTMRLVLLAKARQNPGFANHLLQAGDKPVVEQSATDQFWGATPAPDGTLVGRNILGRLLMELREMLRKDLPEE